MKTKVLVRIGLILVTFLTTATMCEEVEEWDYRFYTIFNDCEEPIYIYSVDPFAEDSLKLKGEKISFYAPPYKIECGKPDYYNSVSIGPDDSYYSPDKKTVGWVILLESTYEQYSSDEIASGKYDKFLSLSFNELKDLGFKLHIKIKKEDKK